MLKVAIEFQFHIGAIKSVEDEESDTLLDDFNSTLVRLKGKAPFEVWKEYENFNSTLVRLKAVENLK